MSHYYHSGRREGCHNVCLRALAVALLAASVPIIGSSAFGGSIPGRSARPFDRKGAQLLFEKATPVQVKPVLPSEMDVLELGGLARAWKEAPKRTFYVSTVRANKSVSVAVHEVGTGAKVIVFIHGLFSDSTNWRYIAGALGDEYQLWLVDLPGCGSSERPLVPRNDLTTYGPESLADRVLQAVESRLAARPDISRFLIAGHSLGGMVVLRMFSDDDIRQRHAETLARVDGLALLAPSDVLVTQATPDWLAFLALNSFKVEVGSALGLIHSAMVDSVRVSFCNSNAATREIVAQGKDLLKNSASRRANQQMMRSALPWEEFPTKPDFEASERLEANYQKVKVPCLIVWGRRDKTLQSAMGYKLKDQLPDARMVVVPNCMHLLPMEQPDACAGLIREFDHHLRRGALAPARSVAILSFQSVNSHLAEERSSSTTPLQINRP